MTKSQKILLRQSEVRQRLAEIRELSGHAVTDEIRTERESLLTELRESETELQKAIKSEGADAGRRAGGDTGESAELRSLCERSRLSAFVTEAHTQSALNGAESELRAAVFGEHARPGLVPWEVLDMRRMAENRADAVTDVSDANNNPLNAGAMSHTVLGRIFADGAASFLGVRMDSVDRGVSAYPVLTAGVTGQMKARGAAKDAEAATVKVESLEPTRLSARYVVRVEDLARISMLEEGLRADLSGALSEAMDKQVIAGDGAAPNVSGLLAEIAAPNVPADVANHAAYIQAAAGAVDGRGAQNLTQVRTLAAVDVYQNAASNFTTSGDSSGADYLLQRSGGFRASPHVPNAPAQGNRAKVGEMLLHRTMAPGSAVAAVWSGFELTIRDDATLASKGKVAITALMLWNFKMLRSGGYARASAKLA